MSVVEGSATCLAFTFWVPISSLSHDYQKYSKIFLGVPWKQITPSSRGTGLELHSNKLGVAISLQPNSLNTVPGAAVEMPRGLIHGSNNKGLRNHISSLFTRICSAKKPVYQIKAIVIWGIDDAVGRLCGRHGLFFERDKGNRKEYMWP